MTKDKLTLDIDRHVFALMVATMMEQAYVNEDELHACWYLRCWEWIDDMRVEFARNPGAASLRVKGRASLISCLYYLLRISKPVDEWTWSQMLWLSGECEKYMTETAQKYRITYQQPLLNHG